MPSKGGWARLHRAVFECHHLQNAEERYAFIWLIMHASWEDTISTLGKEEVPIRRGQLLTSYRKLAKEWDWASPKRVMMFLKRLSEGNATATQQVGQGKHKGTLLTLCNYSKFQPEPKVEETHQETQQSSRGNDYKIKELKKGKELENLEEGPAALPQGEVVDLFGRRAAIAMTPRHAFESLELCLTPTEFADFKRRFSEYVSVSDKALHKAMRYYCDVVFAKPKWAKLGKKAKVPFLLRMMIDDAGKGVKFTDNGRHAPNRDAEIVMARAARSFDPKWYFPDGVPRFYNEDGTPHIGPHPVRA